MGLPYLALLIGGREEGETGIMSHCNTKYGQDNYTYYYLGINRLNVIHNYVDNVGVSQQRSGRRILCREGLFYYIII